MILNASIKDLTRREESDAVNTLIYTILSNFIGANELQLDRSQEQLMNLRCPTLSEFRWYKDVFMTKVLTRNDCHANFWKEKFISELPVLFAERVKNRLKSKSPTNSIDWSSLTYGDLSAEITAEGITLCNDIKLKRQLDIQKEENRNIIGDFCEQIGFQPIQYPILNYIKLVVLNLNNSKTIFFYFYF